ncbi:MAG: hypothetical protein ABIH72_04605 [archaeon]
MKIGAIISCIIFLAVIPLVSSFSYEMPRDVMCCSAMESFNQHIEEQKELCGNRSIEECTALLGISHAEATMNQACEGLNITYDQCDSIREYWSKEIRNMNLKVYYLPFLFLIIVLIAIISLIVVLILWLIKKLKLKNVRKQKNR